MMTQEEFNSFVCEWAFQIIQTKEVMTPESLITALKFARSYQNPHVKNMITNAIVELEKK